MRVLIACEQSGTVRDAFIAAGHDAMSCDLLPSDKPGPHYQGDVFDVLGDGWDLMIAHPPCTYLCSSGLHWNKRRPERAQQTEDALELVRALLSVPIAHITKYVGPRIVNDKERWANQTDSGQNRLPPSADRGKIRSVTYQGIADAMAAQWGQL